ncbi:hypothetical protein A7K93_05400 [Candidatus Methylacidiphilum fumarolicum]|uniref:Uncharacterized protein n=2 Tax=Candidatus Methylacidiphilum fumarolicum TaxID=591154 RepID=I0JZV1_METFB|nr:hypothetical protein [Candidatus Methylacidiphilum fumarolicum]MBW6415809.1 hypothetical protein [Candidatus Methylacidiphilum fumarolicum]TFE66288.1 hypothetical protein A7K73_10460 [Candidatus Methylacidiphilum fumarolicum]TFE71984.1 hypothetical protein A7K72_09700 [Candidatus Methylacidiphilum fumarolicum]TFE73848.1 hypothetical protein A7K93_05400 [Candidatus Methylacidiphilum fumarolicum]TFE77927.1 hypothetical protein A7D33_02320 [Candidatus Methylacidiphilum fumarolicum]
MKKMTKYLTVLFSIVVCGTFFATQGHGRMIQTTRGDMVIVGKQGNNYLGKSGECPSCKKEKKQKKTE